MNNNIEVIGIDHDWSQMKTSNTCFNTSIKELANAPAFHDNVLEYDDRYFAVGEERLEVLDSKVENENFYLLTLVAIAKELEIRGKSEADVVLAVGLPLTRFSAERKPFIDYLSKNRDMVFGFEQKLYTIHILNVLVYPQCYAAVAGMLHTMPQDQVLHQRPRVMPQLMSLSGMKAIRDLSTPLPILTECLETLIFPLTASAYQRVEIP